MVKAAVGRKRRNSGASDTVLTKRPCTVHSGAGAVLTGIRGPACTGALSMPSPLPALEPAMKYKAKPFSVGSDCAGLNASGLALRLLMLDFKQKFLADIAEPCQKMLFHHFPENEIFYSDVLARSFPPYVDVYFSTFPCQPYSSAGNEKGRDDPRGRLVDISLEYIRYRRPRLVVMENVANLFLRFRKVFDMIVQKLETYGYHVLNAEDPLYNTKEHGIPQNRKRAILGAVRKDCFTGAFSNLEPLEGFVKLNCFVGNVGGKAGKLPTNATESQITRVREAYKKAKKHGYDPKKDAVITDIGASAKFSHSMTNVMPCITASRGKTRMYHISTANSLMTLETIERVQGFPNNFYKPRECGVIESAYGMMLGNSVSINVFMRLLPRFLEAAGIISEKPKVDYWEAAIHSLKKRGLVDEY